jgi:murein endopeptidase
VRLPDNPAQYWIRRPEFAYGTTHALTHLQLALARFRRASGYRLPLVVSDISKRNGGHYATHDSHQSGRDVDLWLPLRADALGAAELDPALGPPQDLDFALLNADRPSDVDWNASWQLVKALIRTGEVQYIFLTRTRQRELYRAARAEGLSVQALGEIIQYPRRSQTAIVRHAPDHTRHLHIRFRCADTEPRCR